MVQQLVQRFENESIVKPYWLYPALQQLHNLSLFHEHERWAAERWQLAMPAWLTNGM